ncbi:hypothetical protein [Streptomyces sp. NBC_01216]|uniref:hypothetical protein n=1 Tax=unclassified Streptomyces TaxID=2593676 RepID=UPI002E11F97A|nr:hypothetical protein OG393_07520 [Streptomyces sp. NBC_01216]
MGRTGTVGRRALLLAGAAALGGCTAAPARDAGPKPLTATERAARAEAELRRRSATAGRALLERYDRVLAAHPSLAARLTPLRTSAAAHARALAEGVPAAGAGPAGPSPVPAASGATGPVTTGPTGAPTPATATPPVTASPAPPPVPTDPAAALRELAADIRRTAEAHTAALLDAPPEYARLLASVAAAGAAHVYLLTEGGRP